MEQKYPELKEQVTVEAVKTEDMERQRREKESVEWFRRLGAASFIYACFFVVCMYDNWASVLTPVWMGATVFYVCYVMKKAGYQLKKDSGFYITVMILLGVSSAITGNWEFQFLNLAGFFLMIIVFLLHTVYDDSQWKFGKMIKEILAAILGAMGNIPVTFEESASYFRNRKQYTPKKNYSAFLGLSLAIPFIFVICFLLGSADAVFASFFQNTGIDLSADEWVILIPLMFIFGFFSSYCGVHYILLHTRPEYKQGKARREASGAIAFLSMLTIVYFAFSVIQILYLFLGFGKLPDNMTYATYARTGFFQLLMVSVVNLIVVLFIKDRFENQRILTGILYAVCVCTLIMVASSTYRMYLYIRAYHLTFTRVFVLMLLIMITAIMVGILIYLKQEKFPLFRYSMVMVSVIYLVFSLSHVDYWIASYNIGLMNMKNENDILEYMPMLSTDAAPVVVRYIKGHGLEELAKEELKMRDKSENRYDSYNAKLSWYGEYYDRNMKQEHSSVRTWNLSRYVARKKAISCK